MTTFYNLDDAQMALQQASKWSKSTHNPAVLGRMEQAMAAAGDPQRRLRIIHVAGTSGKTSTATYISALLAESGKRVGLSISPYTYALNDRLRINGELLAEKYFCQELAIFLEGFMPHCVDLSYLELLTVFAFWELDRLRVDYAVVEANAGGRYDATNVADRPDKMCVITDIGYDHTDTLGTTLPEIAGNKAGIIHPNNIAVMLEQIPDVAEVVEAQCQSVGAKLHIAPGQPHGSIRSELKRLPPFQQRNWWLARQAYQLLAARDGLPLLSEAQQAKSTTTPVLGRMELVKAGKAHVIIDAAHNSQKMAALVAGIRYLYPDQPVALLLMVGAHKNIRAILGELLPLQPQLICSQYAHIEGLPHQAHPASDIAETAQALGFKHVSIESDGQRAVHHLLAATGPVKIVTGTLYGLGPVRELLMKAPAKK